MGGNQTLELVTLRETHATLQFISLFLFFFLHTNNISNSQTINNIHEIKFNYYTLDNKSSL